MALAMLCGGTCNALREIIHVILKNDIVFHGDDNYKIVYIKKALQSRKTTGKHPMWALTDSNRRPSACKAEALTQLSETPFLLSDAKVILLFLPRKFFIVFFCQ